MTIHPPIYRPFLAFWPDIRVGKRYPLASKPKQQAYQFLFGLTSFDVQCRMKPTVVDLAAWMQPSQHGA
ncbi:hypothetical protein [Stutzerimonas xanthomarina]|uniref:hypothetical protein n=1 Tax=Stutzerimonas xanthomarina TaxID=271420 RepID=UPI003AA8316E